MRGSITDKDQNSDDEITDFNPDNIYNNHMNQSSASSMLRIEGFSKDSIGDQFVYK